MGAPRSDDHPADGLTGPTGAGAGPGHARLDLGDLGQRAAAGLLKTAGYEIVAQNYEGAGGEVDIIARRGGVLVFVEVKARLGLSHGRPEEAVTPAKQQTIARAARHYIQKRRPAEGEFRFDVIAILFDAARNLLSHQVFEGAFEAEGWI